MGLSRAASAQAHGPNPHRKVKRRRSIDFESFVQSYDYYGKMTKVPIKYSIDNYTLQRTRSQIPRGEGPQWSDPDERLKLIDKLRQKLRRLRESRKADRHRYD